MPKRKRRVKRVRFFQRLWAYWFGFNFALVFLLLYPFFLLTLKVKKLHPVAHRLRRLWGHIIMFNSGLRGRVTYEEALDTKAAYVFAPNHSSYLDILSMNVCTPFYFNFMAKVELAKIPLFGIFFRTIDIAVDRKNTVKAHRAFLRAAEQLRAGQGTVVFPEGTIHKKAPRLSRFKPGAFRLAIESGVPIVPVTILDNWKRLPNHGPFRGTPGQMRMIIHRPIPTAHLKATDADELKQEVFRIIEQQLADSGIIPAVNTTPVK